MTDGQEISWYYNIYIDHIHQFCIKKSIFNTNPCLFQTLCLRNIQFK